MGTFEMESYDGEQDNPVADTVLMNRFSGTQLQKKIPRDFVKAHMAPLHAGRDSTVTRSAVLAELAEAREFVQRAAAVLSATTLPPMLATNSLIATVVRSIGNTVAQLKQVAPWMVGMLQWPMHLAIIFFTYALVCWMESALASDGIKLPYGAFKTNLHRWWPLASHSALQNVICEFQKSERKSKADGTYVPWQLRANLHGLHGLKREWALFAIETMYMLVIIATFQLVCLGGPFCAVGCAIGSYSILKTHQIIYVVTKAYAPQPVFCADDFDHPMRLTPDDPRYGKDLTLDSMGILVEFTDDRYEVALTQLDPGLPYTSKFANYKKDQKYYCLQSKGFITALTIFSQIQILATENAPQGERQQFGESTAQDVADVMGVLTIAATLSEAMLSIMRNPNSGSTAAVRDIIQKIGVAVALVVCMYSCVIESTTCTLLAPGLDDQQCELTRSDAVLLNVNINTTSSTPDSLQESSALISASLISKVLLGLGLTMNLVVVSSRSTIWKTCRHRITLTSQVSEVTWAHWDGPAALVPPDGIATIPDWDVPAEIDIRAWRSVWDATLSSDPALDTQRKRLLAQKTVSRNVPEEAWGARPTDEQHAAMCALIRDLSGNDVYMNDEWTDGTSILTVSHVTFEDRELNSDSKFGQMQVVPYPFYCSFEWDVERYRDSCQARLSLWNHPEKLQEIVDLNNSPDIRRRREIRALLRALAACGSLLSFTHTITRRFAYSMITSANGKTNVETQHWEDVEVSFKRGVISIESTRETSFNVVMTFEDGYGSGPKSGVHINETNQLDSKDLGLTASFSLTPNLVRLLTENGNMHLCIPALLAYRENEQYMRERSSQKLLQENENLPLDFYVAVYSQAVPVADFERYLRMNRATFGNIDATRFDHVRNAAKLVASIKETGKQALWWLFWHDIVTSNPEYVAFGYFPNDFSPFDSDSICFKVMNRDELNDFLSSHGGFSVPPSLLDSLYKALDEQEYALPASEPKWLSAGDQRQLDQLLTRPKLKEEDLNRLVVIQPTAVRGMPCEDIAETPKETEMAAVEELGAGAIIDVLEESEVEGHRCVRIGPDRWVTRTTNNGKINLRKVYSSDSVDAVPKWMQILAAREGHSVSSWCLFLEQAVDTPALSRRYFRVITPITVIGHDNDTYTGVLEVGTEIEAVSVIDDLAGKSVIVNTFELCSNRPNALASVPIVSLGIFEFARVVKDMLTPDRYLQALMENGVTFRATQNIIGYKEVSATSQPIQIPKDSEVSPLEVAFVEMSNGNFLTFIRAEQGWIKTIDDETQLLKWHSTDDDDHHANKFGAQTVFFQLLCDASVYAGLNGTDRINRIRAGTIVEVTRYGPGKRYVSVKKNKNKESRMELVNGGWVCTTKKQGVGGGDVNVCVPCDPALEHGIEEFVGQPKHVRGTEYLEEITSEAQGSRKSDIELSTEIIEAGQKAIDEDSDAAEAAVAQMIPGSEEGTKVVPTGATARQFFACVRESVPVFSSRSGREGPCGQLLRHDVVEVVGTTSGSNAQERLTFQGGYVDLDGMLDITEQIQMFDASGPVAPDPAAQLAGLLDELHDIDCGNDRYTGEMNYPHPYPADFAGVGEPTSAELYACGFPRDTTVGELHAAIVQKGARYGIQVAPLNQQPKKRDPNSFQFPRDRHGRVTYNVGCMSQYQMYSNVVANARGVDPPLFPAEPFEKVGEVGSTRGMAVPAPLGVMLPWNKNFIRQPRPIRTGSVAASACFLLCTVSIILVVAVTALLSGTLPLLLVLGCCQCLCSIAKGNRARTISLYILMISQVLVVLLIEWILDLLCGPMIGWPYSACLRSCDCTCSVGSIISGLTIADSFSIQIAPSMPDQDWVNCAVARDEGTCLYHTTTYMDHTNNTVVSSAWSGTERFTHLPVDRQTTPSYRHTPQCDWDKQTSVCMFRCDRIFDADYCAQTSEWAAATANASEAAQLYCSLVAGNEAQLRGDESIGEMMVSFMRMTTLRDTELTCADCRDVGEC